jgi:hypothetical protein
VTAGESRVDHARLARAPLASSLNRCAGMEKPAKKLLLTRDVVRALTERKLVRARGGVILDDGEGIISSTAAHRLPG